MKILQQNNEIWYLNPGIDLFVSAVLITYSLRISS